MAPKRKVISPDSPSSSHSLSDSEPTSTKKVKAAPKAKKVTTPVIPIHSDLPNNTTFPIELKAFEKRGEGEIRITAWNVCGIKACDKKGLGIYLAAEDADIVILTETKTEDPSITHINDRYPYRYWGMGSAKGQAGTAILSKLKPISVVFGLPTSLEAQIESNGRIITLEFENSYLVGTYVPNAGQGLKNLDKKVAWNIAFEQYLRQLDAVKPVIWTGDINVAQTEKDIRNWKTNYNKTPGCTEKEITGYLSQLNPIEGSGHKKCLDIWRELHPDLEGHYTYFSYRFDCRTKGIGWRLDQVIISERLREKVKQCEIRLEVYGASDHVPIMIDIVGPL